MIIVSLLCFSLLQVKDYKPAMKENIVRLLRTTDGRVNVKARTHEKVLAIHSLSTAVLIL